MAKSELLEKTKSQILLERRTESVFIRNLSIKDREVFEVLSNKKADPIKADFDGLFLEAVDSTLSMLGDSTKKTLYLHLKNTCGISKESIPQNIEVFANILEQVFGQKALLIEARIMETLHSKVPGFRFSPKQGELSFLDYLQSFRCFLFLQRRREKFG